MKTLPTPAFTPIPAYLRGLLCLAMLFGMLVGSVMAESTTPDTSIEQQVRQLALDGTRNVGQARVEVEVGKLDPRLHLAPCQQVQTYLPVGSRLWGRSRIGLRCVQGPSPWNVFMPITVHVYGIALVAAAPLPAGSVLSQNDLAQAEIDLTEAPTAAVLDPAQAVGRTLLRALNPGEGLHSGNLKQRQWFAAGDTVKVNAAGEGFTIAYEGVAITPGLDGQPARVRTESGRVVSGLPVGDRAIDATP